MLEAERSENELTAHQVLSLHNTLRRVGEERGLNVVAGDSGIDDRLFHRPARDRLKPIVEVAAEPRHANSTVMASS